MEDAKKLRLYTQSTASKHQALEDGLGKARSKDKYSKWKAKEGTEKATGVEKKRDEDKEKAQVSRLVVIAAGDAKARVEGDLANVQESLVAEKEAKCRAEVETTCLEVERTSLLLELVADKEEVFSLHS